MRLLRIEVDSGFSLVEFIGRDVPPFAILSHTWGADHEEVTFRDLTEGTGKNKAGYRKLTFCAKQAARDGLKFFWVDTCCIDKSSSAELSEAINSMFQFYKDSVVCYVYLSDLGPSTDILTALKDCRWFTRGWTLQELIAPNNANFFNQNWEFVGSKKNLLDEISSITNISVPVLSFTTPLSSVTVATRMSWAARRQTTKVEDISYCLLGIFNINMPLIYGEGPKAFARLQEEIIKSTCDLSIFAWKANPGQDDQHSHRYSGILAESPRQFGSCGCLVQSKELRFHADFSVTNRGIQIPAGLIASPIHNFQGFRYILCLDCSTEDQSHTSLGLYLRKCGADLFVRDQPSLLAIITPELRYRYRSRTIYVVSKLPERPALTQDGPTQDVDLIISNRVSAIQISLPPGLRTFNAAPLSHHDSQDALFFSTEITHNGWCSIHIRGKLDFYGQRIPVSCFFACFGWNSGSEYLVSTLADLSTCDPISVERLSSNLEREQNDFIPWALEELEHFGIPIQGSVTLANGAVMMSHVVKKVFLPGICKNEMYHVNVFLD